MNMKNVAILLFTSIIICCAYAQTPRPVRSWKATLKVVDEAGLPVAAAKARVFYLMTNEIAGITDKDGLFVASHSDGSENLTFRVEKDGYYPASADYRIGRKYDAQRSNPTRTMLLRKVGTPVPMYAQSARILVPELGKPIGFDLIEGDWIPPYGKGEESDFIFTAHRRFVDWQDFDSSFELTFPHPGDGILAVSEAADQGSRLLLSATAPESGYAGQLSAQSSHTPLKGWSKSEQKDARYYFRVRTVKGADGRIAAACYGKIYGDFTIDAINSKTLLVFFQYYLNPDSNSRNVEFDTNQNLFRHLSSRQAVSRP